MRQWQGRDEDVDDERDDDEAVAATAMLMAVARMLHKMKSVCRAGFFTNLAANFAVLGTYASLAIGTACSGTDLFCKSFSDTLRCCGVACAVPCPRTTHLWSCESMDWKRRWIQTNMCPSKIFTDCTTLHQGIAYEDISGKQQTVDPVFVFAAGFSCRSVSLLNMRRREHATCIKEAKGTTGITWAGCLAYISRWLPVCLFLENVMGLARMSRETKRRDNLEHILSSLRNLGYLVVWLPLDGGLHGLPATRQRVWIFAVLKPTASSSDQSRIQEEAASLEQATRITAFPLDVFTLDEDRDMWATMQLDELASQRKPKERPNAKWHAQHDAFFKRANWDPQASGSLRLAAWAKAWGLTEREASVLQWDAHRDTDTDEVRVSDYSQSVARLPTKAGQSPCITPKAKLVCHRAGENPRLLLGPERLQLQGLPSSSCPSLANFSNRELNDLAGNAFSGAAVSTAVLIMLATFPRFPSACEVEELRTTARAMIERDTSVHEISD